MYLEFLILTCYQISDPACLLTSFRFLLQNFQDWFNFLFVSHRVCFQYQYSVHFSLGEKLLKIHISVFHTVYNYFRKLLSLLLWSSRRTPYGRTPLTESGLAAFPHPALHMADLLSNLCVFNTFLLKSCFLAFPISEYCASYFLGYCPMWLPSLLWHYPHSSVIWSHPTAYTSFAFLLLVE